jgi:peptide/nickel transport system permease protein
MLAFLARRLLATVPVAAVVAVLVFLMLRLTPGDPAAIMAGDAASAEQIQAIRASLGLDRPLPTQLGLWAGRLVRGDLGQSFFFKAEVADLIAQRIGPTLALATTTMVLAVLVAVPLGVLAAWRHGTGTDRLVMGFATLGFSVPVFVLGYLLIWLFALRLGWLPVQGYKPLSAGLLPFLHQLVLPSLTLSVVYIALIARMTRASMLEVLAEDHVRTARAKGLSEPAVLLRHGLRNASVPIVTVIGLGFGLLLGGVVVTESVFNIPGLGRLTIDAVLARDYPTIQGVVLVFSGLYLLLNFLVDLSYGLLDPRIRA